MAQMWIDNRWTAASDERVFEVHNPATEEVLDRAPRASAPDVLRAVAAARRAFPEWRRTPGLEKCEKLHKAAARIRADREGLAILLTKEGGKPLPENRDEVEWIALAGLSGCPATIVPVGRTKGGLPVGLQIVGPYLEDATPIDVGARLADVLGGFVPPPGYAD